MILLNFGKERLALQFVTIMDKYIRNAMSKLGKQTSKKFLKAIDNTAIHGAKEAALVAKRTKLEACKKPFVSAM